MTLCFFSNRPHIKDSGTVKIEMREIHLEITFYIGE